MRTILMALTLLLMAAPVFAQQVNGYQVQFVDEFGKDGVNMTTSASLYIYAAGTTTELTVYKDRACSLECTQPITDDSTNTCLAYNTGMLTFFVNARSFKIVATDGTYTRTKDNCNNLTTRIMWPSFGIPASGTSLGQNDDLDFAFAGFIFDGDTAGTVDLIPDADGGIFNIGSATYQTDFYWYAGAADYVFGDEGNARWSFVDVDTVHDDDAHAYFGSDRDVDFKFTNGSDLLSILHTGGIIAFGSDGDAPDVYVYTENAGDYTLFDEDNAKISLVDVDTHYNDEADAIFGTDSDFTIESDTAKTLEILPGAASDDYAVNLGVDQSGVDLKAFGATTAEYFQWDASNDTLSCNAGNILWTMTDAEANQWKVDATGTVAGYAAVVETTNGGIQLNADGADNGDISVDAADNLGLISGDTVTITNATKIILDGVATQTIEVEGTANAYEATLSFTDPTADVVYTYPVAAAGTYSLMMSTLATNAPDIANSVTGGTNQLIFEGATADASEIVVTPTDPNADATLTLLDYTGGIPAIIGQAAVDECAIDDTTAVDVNNTSISIADQWCSAGSGIKWTLGGTKTGANGTLMVYLYLDDGIQCTLTSSGNTAGDWHAEIIMHEHTDYANQVITGTFIGADGAVTDFDTDTTDFNDGSATTAKCQLDLSHADDSATCDYVLVEAWKK